MPGVICEAAGGHTEGSMNIIVKTVEGDANICGDVIYDFNDQIVEPFHGIGDMEPRVTGNHGTTKRQEKAAIKKVLARSRFALPIHDWPAMIEGGQVVARLRDLCRVRLCSRCRDATGFRPKRGRTPDNVSHWSAGCVYSRRWLPASK